MARYVVTHLETGDIVRPGDIITDNEGTNAYFVMVVGNPPPTQIIVTDEFATLETRAITRYAVDFKLEVTEVLGSLAFWHGDDTRVSVRLNDGRTVEVYPDGRVRILTRDRMHGSEFVIPNDIEWGGTVDVEIARLEPER